ncbi:hypothetical protein F5B19DRAFT_114487 [Rostrohypoxylon terebratum]|nr:hypothetical protein F5B19DRAFT_114487 [Rostrohypoxylon terebratum]
MEDPTDPALEYEGAQTCICCFEQFPRKNLHELECLHLHCTNCIRTIFTTSFEREGNFPPRCCDDPIQITPRLLATLGKDIWSVYIAKRAEFKSPRRVYCSRADCGSFIPEDYKFNHFAVCPQCDALTCLKCKNQCHEGDCPTNDGLTKVKDLAKEKGWAECPKCGHIIEKIEGCNSIVCSCGESVCYQCSNPMSKCTCMREHYDRWRAQLAPAGQRGWGEHDPTGAVERAEQSFWGDIEKMHKQAETTRGRRGIGTEGYSPGFTGGGDDNRTLPIGRPTMKSGQSFREEVEKMYREAEMRREQRRIETEAYFTGGGDKNRMLPMGRPPTMPAKQSFQEDMVKMQRQAEMMREAEMLREEEMRRERRRIGTEGYFTGFTGGGDKNRTLPMGRPTMPKSFATASFATTSQPAPPPQQIPKSDGCRHHHHQQVRDSTLIMCPDCQHSSSHILRCKGCSHQACWKCFQLYEEKSRGHEG